MKPYEIAIQVDVELPLSPVWARQRLTKAATATLQKAAVAHPATLTLLLTSAERLQELNRTFRHENKTTDVLSFPAEQDVPGMEGYLGDVAIAISAAQAQATAAGHGFLSELTLLAVHGVLHLVGHDHSETDERQAMWAIQDQILEDLGLSLRSPR